MIGVPKPRNDSVFKNIKNLFLTDEDKGECATTLLILIDSKQLIDEVIPGFAQEVIDFIQDDDKMPAVVS